MRIVVASGNIFRREFSSYTLAEAGYEIAEARAADGLLSVVRGNAHRALVIDQHLLHGELPASFLAVRAITAAPVIWIGDQQRLQPILLLDQRPARVIQWPFRGDELVAAVAALIAAADAEAAPRLNERYAGSAQ